MRIENLKNRVKLSLLAFALFLSAYGQAQLKKEIGNADFSDWSGMSKTEEALATFKNGKTLIYKYPESKNSAKGFREYFSGCDWSVYSGLSFDIYQKNESGAEIEIAFKVNAENTRKLKPQSNAVAQLHGSGWQNVYVPWSMFNLPQGQRGALQGVGELNITVNSDDNKMLQIRNVVLTKGKLISLEAPIQGKANEAGEKVEYAIELGNTSGKTQKVQLLFTKVGWESMQTSVIPSAVELAPGEIKQCLVEVSIPASLPQGVREKQILKAIPNGDGSAVQTIEFTTSVKVPSPFMVHTEENWQIVKNKIDSYDWAKHSLAEYESRAQKWNVPEIARELPSMNTYMGQHLFHSNEGGNLMNCAIAYRLTGKKEYAGKCVDFIRKLVDPETGYPTTLRVNQNNFVKEGGIFQDVARSYDMILDCGLLTDEDHELVEKTFRLFIETVQLGNDEGGIGNWDLSELAGAFYCALVIQDWHLVDWTLNSPSGIIGQLVHGVMSDGWWYECSVGYNLWCSTMFSEVAIAMQPWGINMVNEKFPIGTTPYYSLLPERMQPGLFGMDFNKWGAMHKPDICIKDMWDALIPFLDYRGVMFAVNDAQESLVTGEPYELAYYLYGDPEYASVIKRGDKRNLLYGVPDLPEIESEKNKQSAYADNMGIVQLRSQSKGRNQREQIQAALHYGTHGGYHGHFDRTNFLSMMRYGRSFYNPEMIWYGYQSYNYKFLVQTSMTKNMVVVDQKMQEPTESFRTMFYTGEMMQATAVETNSRWSNPPYGGMIYGDKADYTFAQKAWEEGRSLYIPDDAPEYGKVSDFTEPVLQRRLMLMMDDYVVLADYIQAEEEHTYDWLFHMKGLKEITAPEKEFLRHDKQLSSNPLGAAQFFTDVNWYRTEGTSRTSFEMCFGKGCDNQGTRAPNSEDGPLKMDIFNAWPSKNEIAVATVPESHSVNKQLWFDVEADGTSLLNDSTGAWILGSKEISLNLKGKKKIVLRTKLGGKPNNNSIFWGNAKLVLNDGSEVYLSSLNASYENVIKTKSNDVDYDGGPVKIGGALMTHSIPGMPDNFKEEASITFDIAGMDVVRFEAIIGSDFPLGDETARRKTINVRSKGKKARFLSVIEPYESESMIKSVTAESASDLLVELSDGRTQRIHISGLEGDGKKIEVSTREFVNGKLVRSETSSK